jgi:hypothetical protein
VKGKVARKVQERTRLGRARQKRTPLLVRSSITGIVVITPASLVTIVPKKEMMWAMVVDQVIDILGLLVRIIEQSLLVVEETIHEEEGGLLLLDVWYNDVH